MPNPLEGIGTSIAFLIIAPDEFLAAVQPLAQHKNLTGMSTMAVSVESLTTFFPGADTPEKVKRGIQYAYETMDTRFVMLVGDAAHFPVRFWFLRQSDTPTYPDGTWLPQEPWGLFVQSDLYYANLYHHTGAYPNLESGSFDTWDANGNGLYNEAWIGNGVPDPANPTNGLNTACNPDDVDGYPDIAVGRMPAGSTADIQNYVDKIIAYETSGVPQVPMFTFVGDEKYQMLGATTNMGNLVSSSLVNIDYLLIENDGAPPVAPFANATHEQVGLQAGVSSWVSYIGHGGPTAWGDYGVFTSADIALTTNMPGRPVVFVGGCLTALFMTNVPWNGWTGGVTSIDVEGVTRGPFEVNPKATPGSSGLVMTDTATGRKWGVDTPGCDPLPVPTPSPAALNVPYICCANLWLFDHCPGGAVAYIADHCVSNDQYPAEIETSLLTAYITAANPILGDLYLTAQQQYWAGPHSKDATTPGLQDYHGIPRLYLGWMVFFGDPTLRLPSLTERLAGRAGDFDGDGLPEVLVSSAWGVGILKQAGAAVTGLAATSNGSRIGNWLLETNHNDFGPVADFDGDGRDEILVTSAWGLAILKLVGDALTVVVTVANGTDIGGWTSDTTQDVLGPVADYDGDGEAEILVSNATGVAILKLTGGAFTILVQEANGARLNGWLVETAANRFGAAADYDGDGRAEILVTSVWGVGMLKLVGGTLASIMLLPNGTSIGGWLLDTPNNSFIGSGDFDGDGLEELLVTSAWGIGILKLVGETLTDLILKPNGTRLGAWLLETRDNRLGPTGDYDGDGLDELLVTSAWGIGILKLDGDMLSTAVIEPNGARLGEWVLSAGGNCFGSMGNDRSRGQVDLLVTSLWGLGILRVVGSTLQSTALQQNGTRLGDWLLETRENFL